MQQQQLEVIASLCSLLGSMDDNQRGQAEAQLKEYNNANGFLLALLEITQNTYVTTGCRIQAAIYLKNVLSKRWCLHGIERDPDNPEVIASVPVNEDEKNQMRTRLIPLMASSEGVIARQLVECLVQIGLEDYYVKWPSMMNELTSICSSGDVNVINRVLTVIEGICRVIEVVPDNDIVGDVVLHFVDDLNTFTRQMWELFVGLIPEMQNDYDRLELVLSCLLMIANTRRYWIMVDVTRDINTENEVENASCVDLQVWMGFFSDILKFKNDMFLENPTPTVMEELKASIIEFSTICVKRHTELFLVYFESFSSSIWELLSMISTNGGSLKFQDVAVSSLHFFSSVILKRDFRQLFESEDMLRQIIQSVIVPNCVITDMVMEQFENQPHLYVKNYEEGYKTNSQRYAVSNLINCLKNNVPALFTPLLMQAIAQLVEGPAEQRDCAYHLFLYRCCQYPSIQRAVMKVDDLDSLQNFFNQIVMNDLMAGNASPLIVCDALVCCGVFISFLSDEQLKHVILRCSQLLAHDNQVVKVMSVIVMERVITRVQIKSKQTGGVGAVTPADLKSIIPDLSTILLTVSMPLKQTDHYFIKTFLRIVLFMNTEILSFAQDLLVKLVHILSILTTNLTNPHYIHFLFEALVAFVRIASSDVSLLSSIENYLMPFMQDYLSRNIVEFMPYIFQLFGLMLYSQPGISPVFMNLLTTILNVNSWTERSNQTALVSLLSVYLIKNPQYFIDNNQIPNLLRIFNILWSQRKSRVNSFEFLAQIARVIPLTILQNHMQVILPKLFDICTHGASSAVKESILLVIAILTIRNGSNSVMAILNSQGKETVNTFFRVLLKNGIETHDEMVKKTEIVGLSQLLRGEQELYQPPYQVIGNAVIAMVKTVCYDAKTQSGDGLGEKSLGEMNVEYDAYHKLALAKIQTEDLVPQVGDLNMVVKETLGFISNVVPGGLNAVIECLSQEDREYLKKRL